MKNKDKKREPKTTSFRLAEADHIIEELVKQEGKTASAIMRKAIHLYADQGSVLNIDLTAVFDELYSLKIDLARIGGNLNQIARHFNTTAELKESELNETLASLRIKTKETIDLLDKINGQLGNFLNGNNILSKHRLTKKRSRKTREKPKN